MGGGGGVLRLATRVVGSAREAFCASPRPRGARAVR